MFHTLWSGLFSRGRRRSYQDEYPVLRRLLSLIWSPALVGSPPAQGARRWGNAISANCGPPVRGATLRGKTRAGPRHRGGRPYEMGGPTSTGAILSAKT